MSVNSSLSLSEELNKSYDSSNLNFSLNEKEEKEEDNSFFAEEKRRISKISLHLQEIKQKNEIVNKNKDIEDISTDEYDHEFELEENKVSYKSPIKSSVNIRSQNSFSKFDIYFSLSNSLLSIIFVTVFKECVIGNIAIDNPKFINSFLLICA